MESSTGPRPDHVDLCIIGSGSGLSLIDDDINDWQIALVDNGVGPIHIFGGTCLNAGCIPSKMFAYPARYALAPTDARRVDVDVEFGGADFKAIQQRTFGRTDAVAEEGLAGLESRPNVQVLTGRATFVDERTIRVGQRQITADRIVIAAGSRPRMPEVPGFDEPYLQAFVHTSETIMRIEELPKKLVILGGGVEAVEFGHIFAGMGCQVSIITRSEPLLRHHDAEVASRVTEAMARRMVLRLNQQVTLLEPGDSGGVVLSTQDATGIEYTYEADAVLVCLGRIPNGDQLRIENAGLTPDPMGFVPVDQYQRTSVQHIWALGDVCSSHMLKHLANRQARVVKQNLLAERDGRPLQAKDERFLPQGVFGEPEVATVGLTEAELNAAGIEYLSYVHEYAWVAYGWALNDQEHCVKLISDPAAEQLLGAHIIGPQATSLIHPLVQAMTFNQRIEDIARAPYWIHPALTEVVENALLGLLKLAAERSGRQ
ncbi:MAG: mycothione reductase [Brooklawnia sp.]|uniref:mycothione reductase n=1 Tax=Brooklawnia sp. TaxID=2699740 RepID=UPI003C73980C